MFPVLNTYHLLAHICSAIYPVEKLKKELSAFNDWELLVKIGSQQLLLPAIYRSLERKSLLQYLPTDLQDYLLEIYTLNTNRNSEIIRQKNHLHKLFHKEQIQFAWLKGAAIIGFLEEEDHGLRMLGDIDILISSNQIDRAEELLFETGYKLGAGFNYEKKNYRHKNRLIHEDFIAALELHRDIVNKNGIPNLTPPLIIERSDRRSHLPSVDDLIQIGIWTSIINDHLNLFNTLNFRLILDCILVELPDRQTLYKTLINQKKTRFFMDSASYFFEDFKLQSSPPILQKSKIRIEKQFYRPNKYLLSSKTKKIFLNIKERLSIFASNGSYRRHVLKNKIFQRFN